MWLDFVFENTHFALNLFAALVFFATGWLYFDAWSARKTARDVFKVFGLLLISASFVVHAVNVESLVLITPLLGSWVNPLLTALFRIGGYLLLILGLAIDPLQDTPFEAQGKLSKTKSKKAPQNAAIGLANLPFLKLLPVSFPLLSVAVAFLYLRRATFGLENHLKIVALSFYVLTFYELLALAALLRGASSAAFYKLVAPFGWLWMLEHLVLLVSVLLLGKWVYYYLIKRLQSQLFMIFTVLILAIFLLTTVTFTGLLLKNLQDETLKRLETDVRVLNYAVESKKAQVISDAQVLAQDTQVVSAIESQTKNILPDITEKFLLAKKLDLLVIVSDSGQVLSRGEDRDRVGDSLSDDLLIKRALLGDAVSSVVKRDGVLGPEVSIRAVVPIKSAENKLTGVVMAASTVDSAFVDGIKNATGLETAVYGDNVLSASTISSGGSRLLGVTEQNPKIKDAVLARGDAYSGAVKVLNTPYFAAYLPLKDADNVPVGMLFVGREQIGVLAAAGKSIELTFIVTAILLVLSIVPAFAISRYLTNQLK